MKNRLTRRSFFKGSIVATIGVACIPHASFAIHHGRTMVGEIVGQGKRRYRIDKHWGLQDPSKFPVKNCHEMVQDSIGRIILTTDHTRNNIIFFDKTGRILHTWGTEYPGAHGLTLSREGTEDFLFLTDTVRHQVYKTTMEGKVLMTLDFPREAGVYADARQYLPTEVAVAPNGDFYVADGYGENYIIQYDHNGRYVRHFGGKGSGKDQFDCCHGITVDDRYEQPTLLITSRSTQEIKRFTLDGDYLETISVPGCWICRPVIKGDLLYLAVLGTRSWWEYDGLLVIMDKENRLISAPGAEEPDNLGDVPIPDIVYDGRTFMNPHDVCVDDDDNLYVPQWFSGNSYPVKLERI